MNQERFYFLRMQEDKRHLVELERLWIRCRLLSILETDPFEKEYFSRLSDTTDELIIRLQAKMVKRYVYAPSETERWTTPQRLHAGRQPNGAGAGAPQAVGTVRHVSANKAP